MQPIKIAGVPEHFNTPWKYALDHDLFAKTGLQIEFLEYGNGTAAMCEDLSSQKIDMAIVLTEGVIKYQQIDPSIKIISQFVDTPLNWGIHIGKDSLIKSIDELQHARFAVSRLGSGSHLMACVLANNRGWNLKPEQFIVVGGIEALGQSILEKKADVFLWEVLTTKPFLDRYQLKLLATLPTPWPCFQIAVSGKFSQQVELINRICECIFSVNREFNANPTLAATAIKKFYHLPEADILSWLKTVKWTETLTPPDDLISQVKSCL